MTDLHEKEKGELLPGTFILFSYSDHSNRTKDDDLQLGIIAVGELWDDEGHIEAYQVVTKLGLCLIEVDEIVEVGEVAFGMSTCFRNPNIL